VFVQWDKGDFLKLMASARTRGGEPVRTYFGQGGEASIFRDFVRTSFMDWPLQCHLLPIAALTQSIENELANAAAFRCFFSQRFGHGAALKIEHEMSDLNIAFDLYASIGTVMHYILISKPESC